MSVYGNISNINRIFEVKRALNILQQEDRMFKYFYGEFRGLWAELNLLRPPTTNVMVLNERREQDQVFGLILSLNSSFKGLIHHILRFDTLPSLNEVYMMVQKEEGSKELFHGASETAFVSRGSPLLQTTKRNNNRCDHCKRSGHQGEILAAQSSFAT